MAKAFDIHKSKKRELIAGKTEILESWKEYFIKKLLNGHGKLKDKNKENQSNRSLQGEGAEIIPGEK